MEDTMTAIYMLVVDGGEFVYGTCRTVQREADALRAAGKAVIARVVTVDDTNRDEVAEDCYLYG